MGDALLFEVMADTLSIPGAPGAEVAVTDGCYLARHRPMSGSYSDADIDTVFERGRTEDGDVHCYLCDEVLERDMRKCTCLTDSSGQRKKRRCVCGAWEIEHVVAKYHDPSLDCIGNLLPACVACNSASWKGNHRLHDLIRAKGVRIQAWVANCSDLCTSTQQTILAALTQQVRIDEPRWMVEIKRLDARIKDAILEQPRLLDENTKWEPIGGGRQGEVVKVSHNFRSWRLAVKILTGVEDHVYTELCLKREIAAHLDLQRMSVARLCVRTDSTQGTPQHCTPPVRVQERCRLAPRHAILRIVPV